MKLIIGISDKLPEWELVLRQIGVPFQEIDTNKVARADELAVLILSSLEKRENIKSLRDYLLSGGVILTEADIAKRLLNIPVKRVYIKYLFAGNDSVFSGIPLCDLDKWCNVATDAQNLENQREKNVITIKAVGKGKVIILPSGFVSSVLDFRVKRKSFQPEGGERLPSERVAQVTKGSIRQIIQKALEYLFHFRGLPFVHLWYFPNGAKSIFSFRVDTDFGSLEEVENLYRICRRNSIRATWFVETKTQEEWVSFYRDMEDQEIGYHCYRHRIFRDYQSNQEDIQKGLVILQNAGIQPVGYAAPYGEWHPVLGKIIQDQKFEYSSEFGHAYDDFPFFPFLEKSFSTVLQVPIHPVSIGNLRRARHTSEQTQTYFERIIRQKINSIEPIFIYHHPTHDALNVFDNIFQKINQQNIPSVTLEYFSKWWKQRDRIRWDIEFKNQKLFIKVKNNNSSVYLRIVSSDKKQAIIPFDEMVMMDQLSWQVHNGYTPVSYEHRLLRRYHWRMFIYELESYYGKSKQ